MASVNIKQALPLLRKYLPDELAAYGLNLVADYHVLFELKHDRRSRRGDYTLLKPNLHRITVNRNLPPQSFAVTFFHEVAHLLAFAKFGRRIKPHGEEWKTTFKLIMLPVMKTGFFEPEVMQALVNYIANPKASTCSDKALSAALKEFKEENKELSLLEETPFDVPFAIGKRIFKKMERKRSRYLCVELDSQRHYLVQGRAMVKILE